MEDNIFKKRNPEAVPWRKKYPVWLDRYLGVVVSISIHLVLLAFLSYLIFYTPTEKKQHFNKRDAVSRHSFIFTINKTEVKNHDKQKFIQDGSTTG